MENVAKVATPIIAVILVIGVIVLIALGINVPPELWAGTTLALGFFFGKQ